MPSTGLSRTSMATRARILDVATEVFAADGFRGASLRDIATRAGLTHPALIYHFPTKSDLLIAVLARRDEEDLGRFPLPEDPTPADRAERLLDIVSYNQTQRTLVSMYTLLAAEATDADHPAHGWLARRFERAHEISVGLWEGSDLSEEQIEAEILSIYALVDGLQIRWLLAPDRVDPAALLRVYLERIGVLPGRHADPAATA